MVVLLLGAVFGLEVGVALAAALSSFLGARAEAGLDPLDESEAEVGRARDPGVAVLTGTPDLVGEVGAFRGDLGGDLLVGDLVVVVVVVVVVEAAGVVVVVVSAGVCAGWGMWVWGGWLRDHGGDRFGRFLRRWSGFRFRFRLGLDFRFRFRLGFQFRLWLLLRRLRGELGARLQRDRGRGRVHLHGGFRRPGQVGTLVRTAPGHGWGWGLLAAPRGSGGRRHLQVRRRLRAAASSFRRCLHDRGLLPGRAEEVRVGGGGLGVVVVGAGAGGDSLLRLLLPALRRC